MRPATARPRWAAIRATEASASQDRVKRDQPSSDLIARLERLGSLRDKGIISEQEFQSKKAALLARL
jgi:hypothetical protein